MQHDLKRLLAYHSVENIGIILIGIGLSMVFIGSGHPVAGVLGLIAGLYHTLNHAVFKALLFLGAGAVLKSTGLRNLNEMGGLIRYMPHTALYFLVGALAISALPPLNGFVSEWLTFQAALQAPLLGEQRRCAASCRSSPPCSRSPARSRRCASSRSTASLSSASTVTRSPRRRATRRCWERAGMAWLALGCVALGLLPVVRGRSARIASSLSLVGARPARGRARLRLAVARARLRAEQASYSPIVFLLGHRRRRAA